MKITVETKLKAVDNHETISSARNKYGIQKSRLKYPTALYWLYARNLLLTKSYISIF